jgi:hypothetical protein
MQKYTNVKTAVGCKLKFAFYFMDRTHETLHLGKLSFVHTLKNHGHTYKYYFNCYSLCWKF